MRSSSDGRTRGLAGRFDRVIVFDLDDTLYLERDYVFSGFRAVGRWATTALGLNGLDNLMWERFQAGSRAKIFDHCLLQAGLQPNPITIARMLAVYRQHRPVINLPLDSQQLFEARDAKTAFAVITDGFLDAQKRKIRALDLFRRGVHLGICTDRWGRDCWKPHPRSFLHVQNVFGFTGKYCTYIGDNLVKDFQSPRALGWNTVRIERPHRVNHFSQEGLLDADRVIENFGEF